MWIIIKFYNIIIKSANVDKGYNANPQNVDKNTFFFKTLPLASSVYSTDSNFCEIPLLVKHTSLKIPILVGFQI